jgi:hypothetical protein
MRYLFTDVMEYDKKFSGTLYRAMQQGRLLNGNAYIDLPDDFVFEGDKPPSPVLRGLGDVVAMVAQPMAKMIDRIAGTNLANCAGCGNRQDALNKVVPFNNSTLDNENKSANSPNSVT